MLSALIAEISSIREQILVVNMKSHLYRMRLLHRLVHRLLCREQKWHN